MAERFPLDRLPGAHFTGAPFTETKSSESQFAGRTTINSGDATKTVSTMLVQSGGIILALAATSIASNVAQDIRVSTISPGNFFTFAINPAPVGTDFSIMWFMVRG